jgi:anti-sigma B factor antagonist
VEVRKDSRPGAVVYRISGKLDAVSGPDLGSAIAVGEENPRLILDLRQVSYVSSAGLKGIIQAVRRVQAAKGAVAIFGLQPLVREVFDAAGFGNIIPIAADEGEARAKLGA